MHILTVCSGVALFNIMNLQKWCGAGGANMESFYHSVYGITPYVPPSNLVPVVAQNATVDIATFASTNAVFSHAVFTSLILMSVTSGLNQDTVVENKTTAFVPDRTSFYEGKGEPGPEVPNILPTVVPALANSAPASPKDAVFVSTTSSSHAYQPSRDGAVTWPKTFPTTRRKMTMPPSTIRPQRKQTYPPLIWFYEYFTTATTITRTMTKRMPTTSTAGYVPFNIPRQEIILKKETVTIENKESTERNEKIVSKADLLAVQ
jgi:hypothetical protein